MKNITKIGTGRQSIDLLSDQSLINDFSEKLRKNGLPNIDMRRTWTHHFPKIFHKKPVILDWQNERLFKIGEAQCGILISNQQLEFTHHVG